jgi:hypothetical protein
VEGAEIEMAREAPARLFGGDDFEKLLLPGRLADGGEQLAVGARRFGFAAHGQGLTTTRVPAA